MRARRNNLIWAAGTLLSGRKCYQGTCGCLWDYTEGVDNIFTELVWMWSEGFIVEFFWLRESYQGICGWLWEYIVCIMWKVIQLHDFNSEYFFFIITFFSSEKYVCVRVKAIALGRYRTQVQKPHKTTTKVHHVAHRPSRRDWSRHVLPRINRNK